MEKYILLAPVLLVLAIVVGVFLGYAKPKAGVWFGVSLPKEALDDKRLLALQSEYRKGYALFALLAAIAALPILWFADTFSLSFIYVFLWLAGVMYTSTVPFKRIHYKAAKLKRDNDWFAPGARKKVRIDVDIALMKGKLPLAPHWFALPALMSVPLIVISLREGVGVLRYSGFASLFMTVVMFLLYLAFSRGALRAHSRNPVPNAAINIAANRLWSILWFALAVFEAVNAFIAYRVLSNGNSGDPGLWFGGIFMVSLVPLIGIFVVHQHIKELEYRYGDTDGNSIPADGDAHWRHGLSYYNPKDKSVFVSKRIGIGTTINMATRAGKMIYFGALAFVAAILIPVTIMIVRADTSPPKLVIQADEMVVIDDSMYPLEFALEDVLELTLEDEMPSGFRQNGIATSEYARGNFKLTELGEAKMYIFKQNAPYIVIKLPDRYVVYNEKEPAATEALFAKLEKLTAG
jgi:cbb3-type cytochrome oxidase subunit 3